MFDYRTVVTMTIVSDMFYNLNRLQFDLQNKKADLSYQLSRGEDAKTINDEFLRFSVSANEIVGIQEQVEFLESQIEIIKSEV